MTYRERITHTHTYRERMRGSEKEKEQERRREASMRNYSFGGGDLSKRYMRILFYFCNFSISLKLFLKRHVFKGKRLEILIHRTLRQCLLSTYYVPSFCNPLKLEARHLEGQQTHAVRCETP